MIGVLKRTTKHLPGVSTLLHSTLYKRLRHRVSLMTHRRENSTFTGFYRLPTQFEALAGPVIEFLSPETGREPLEIIVFGSSNGAEPYTVASVLMEERPDLHFRISAYDIDPEIIEKARGASYSPEEDVYNNKVIPEDFVERTFIRDRVAYRVKPEIADHVRFEIGDALDPELKEKINAADILLAQNFLFHLEPRVARTALRNLCSLLKPRSAIFLDGTDLELRRKIVSDFGLRPLDYRLEEIHEEARRARAVGWPYAYWGLEPFMMTSKHWKERYSTIFLQGADGPPPAGVNGPRR